MIYAQDEPVVFPVADLYDSGMMQMYINAVQREYERGLAELKEFTAKYGDFTSPFYKDVEYWNLHTMEPLILAVNELLAKGIDPNRSPEARAYLTKIMRNIPYHTLSNMREAAKIGEEYRKNRGELALKNLYNDDYETFILQLMGLPRFEDWDTSKYGAWTRTSPGSYQDLNEYTGHIFDKMEDDFIGTEDGYDYFGVSRDRRKNALTASLPGIINSDLGKYHYHKARLDALARLGRTPTESEVMELFLNNILTATSEYEHRTRKENEEHARAREYYWNDRLAANNHARQMQLLDLKNEGKSGSGSGNGSSGEGYSYYRDTYNSFLANAASSEGLKYNYRTIGDYYDQVSDNIGLTLKLWFYDMRNHNGFVQSDLVINRFSKRLDEGGVVKWMGNSTLSTNNRVMIASPQDLDNLKTKLDIERDTYGNPLSHGEDYAKNIKKLLKRCGAKNVTILPLGEGYGAVMKHDNAFHIYAKVRITATKPEGKIVKYDMYIDTGMGSLAGVKATQGQQGGYYIGLKNRNNGGMMSPMDVNLGYNVILGSTPYIPQSDDMFNMFPIDSHDLNNRDTRTSTYYGAGQSVKKDTY